VVASLYAIAKNAIQRDMVVIVLDVREPPDGGRLVGNVTHFGVRPLRRNERVFECFRRLSVHSVHSQQEVFSDSMTDRLVDAELAGAK
jgi:hypothetical protein